MDEDNKQAPESHPLVPDDVMPTLPPAMQVRLRQGAPERANYDGVLPYSFLAENPEYAGQARFGTLSSASSMAAALENTPIWQTVKGVASTIGMADDPVYDALPDVMQAANELGWGVASRIADAGSKAEADFLRQQYARQAELAHMTAQTVLGTAASVPLSMMNTQDLLATIGTAGVGAWGVVAKSLGSGLTALTARSAAAAAIGSHVGGMADYKYNASISMEDVAWGTLLNAPIGGLVGRQYGRVIETAPDQVRRFNDIGGALGQTIDNVFRRFSGEGYTTYAREIAKQHSAREGFKNAMREAGHTGMFEEGIVNLDWTSALARNNGKITDEEMEQWWQANKMDDRLKHVTALQKALAGAPDSVNTLFDQIFKSDNMQAKVLAMNMMEMGTGAVVNNKSFAIQRHVIQERLWASYASMYSSALSTYSRRMFNAENPLMAGASMQDKAKRLWTRMQGDLRYRARFNEEVVLYANYKRSGRQATRQWSPEVVEYFDKYVDPTNRKVLEMAQRSGLKGWDEIKDLGGYLPQRHDRNSYKRALAHYGGDRKQLVALITKSLQSNFGAGITDAVKAEKIADAFVRRFLDDAANVSFRNALPDEAWEILDDILQKEGVQLPDGTRGLIQAELGQQAGRTERIGFGRSRVPLDLEVEHGGIRMLDLIDTDIENLLGSYAVQMSGQVALAKTGFKSYDDFVKVTKQIEARNPELSKQMEFLRAGVLYNRPAQMDDPIAVGFVKAGVLAFLNNLGFAQLAETGTAMAALGVANYMKAAGNVAVDMWKGRKTPKADALARELNDALQPIGIEHWYNKPHLMKELISNSTLSTQTLGDKANSVAGLLLNVQGYTSGFNTVRMWQQKTIAEAYTNIIATQAKRGWSPEQTEFLASVGFNRKLMDAIRKETRHMEELPDGSFRMNINKWDEAVAEEFSMTMSRNLHALIQKPLLGESVPFMSTNMGGMLMQFMSYPILSLRKQLARNATLGGQDLALSTLYSAIVAGTAITARNYLTGSSTEADLESVIRQGIVYNANLGSVAQFYDLGLSLTGAPDAWRLNPWSAIDKSIIAPVGINAVNQWLQLPSAMTDALDGEMTADSLRAIRAMPVFGNITPFAWMMRKDNEQEDDDE